ncbi:MAG TPA: glycosyltransferase [Polyangiaceae bacterium]|nr:glycosyltransferase [Polyangiaceae bacterium]
MALKIAHVTSSMHTGGAERIALLLVSRLVQRGHDVTLVSLEEPRDGRLEVELREAGARVVRIPKTLHAFDKTLSMRVLSFFLRERFDVVHTHNPIPLIYAALPGRLSGARVVHTKHGPHPDTWQRVMLRRIGAASSHAFCAVSRATADFALSLHEVQAKKLHVVLNGTDLDRFRPDADARHATRAELAIPADAWVVGTVGRMAKVKNHPLLVRAMAPLLGETTRLVIVGHGDEAAATRALAEELGVARFCHFPGETRDVPRFVAAFDVFALSSDSEGLPLSLAEAMAAELPIVATSVGGVPKVVDDGETGILVPPNDDAALRHALARLEADRPLARLMARRGREVAHARYSAERMTDEYEALYRGD